MKHIKSVNELLGIGKALRGLSHSGESDADEILFLLGKLYKLSDISFKVRKGKTGQTIKTYIFSIDRYSVKLSYENWITFNKFHIKTPGTTEYSLEIDGSSVKCSHDMSKKLYKKVSEIYKKTHKEED